MSELAGLLNNLRARFEAEGVPFAVGGAFALAARARPRQTDDLDIMVVADDLAPVHRALKPDRYTMVNEVTFRDARTGLHLDLFPVEDEAQRFAFEGARREDLEGASGIPVLDADGLAVMLLREATEGDPERRPLRLRDVELLAIEADLDWETVSGWARRMGYEDAYEDLQAEGKLPLDGDGADAGAG